VIFTDIADFYQRIYLHRIENTLDSATANKGVKRFIEKIIKQVRSKQSYDRLYCDWVKSKAGKLGEVLDARSALAKE